MFKCIILSTLILLPLLSWCQVDEPLRLFHKALDEKKKENAELQKYIVKLEARVNELVARPSSRPNELKKALQDLVFANRKVQQLSADIKKLDDSLKNSNLKNEALTLKVEELTKEIAQFTEKENRNEKKRVSDLTAQGRQAIYEEAKAKADADFESGKKQTSMAFLPYKEPLIILAAEYKTLELTKGDIAGSATFGFSINRDTNIFIGIGIGYDSYGYALPGPLLSIFASSKFVLAGKQFVTADGSNKYVYDYPFGYFLVDFGYGFKVDSSDSYKGGFFSKIGFGAGLPVGPNFLFMPELTLAFQNVGKFSSTNGFEREFINTVNIKIGFCIYLGR